MNEKKDKNMYRFFFKIVRKIDDEYWSLLRNIIGRQAIDRKNRRRLKNTDISIIASTCNGGIISHDLGLEFRSPFVNLWMEPGDYIKLVSNLKEYLQFELNFISEEGARYPVAMLNDIRLFFQHYKTKEEAESCWKRRLKRMNYDNIAVLFTDRDGCTYQMLQAFDSLPYERKVAFTHINYPELQSTYFFDCFANEDEVGVLSEYENERLQIRYLDKYDYVSLLNKGQRE